MEKEENEIEVTPEMIEAGLLHLYRYHPEHGVPDVETVTRIYRAMRAAEGRSIGPDDGSTMR
jgi:hypothetical protein